MLYSILPHSDLNRAFDAFPNHSNNYGWTNEFGVWVFPKDNGNTPAVERDFHMRGSFYVLNTPTLARVGMEWSANNTAGQVRWQFGYRVIRGDNTETTDVDLNGNPQQLVAGNQNAPTTARFRRVLQATLTVGNFQKGDRVYWRLARLGTHAQDTMEAPALLFGLAFDDGA